MPINEGRYHRSFKKKRLLCLERDNYTCRQCGKRQGEEFTTKSGRTKKVSLQVHHPNHDPWNPTAALVTLCEPCHLEADKWHRADNARRTKYRKKREAEICAGQLELPGLHAKNYRVIPSGQGVTRELRYHKCKDASCGICENGKGHDPYWVVHWCENGKSRFAYIGKKKPMEAERNSGTNEEEAS